MKLFSAGHLSTFASLILASTSIPSRPRPKDYSTIIESSVSYQIVNGTRSINYISQGPPDGPLVIFLHGWPAVAETWKHQLDHFANLGYYAVAPDMPGYGKSSAGSDLTDYAQENVVPGMLALLEDTGRTKAIWVAHDWGCGTASSLVATHPEVVEAMAWLAVPYKTLELGYVEMLRFVNRTIYPVDEYPYGQWEYMKYYEEAYDRVTAVFNSSIDFSVKNLYTGWDGNASILGTPGPLSQVRRDGGWFGGLDQLPSAANLPIDTRVLDEDLYEILFEKMNSTGFGPADAWYMNHDRNRAFNLEQQKNGGYLDIPCLFIEAKYDQVCDTAVSNLLSPMPEHCKDFTFVSMDTEHWVYMERPEEVNAAITKWLVDNVKSCVP